MQDKKTYTIDENALREKFSNYHVSFDPSSLDFLDNEIAHVKTHQPIELPEAKNIVKLIAIPVSLVVLGCIVYFGYGYVKSISPSAASTPKDTIIITKKINAPIKEEHKVPDVQVSTPTVSVETETKKQVTSLTPVVPQKIKNTVKATVPEPIVVPKKDSTPVSSPVRTPVADTIEKKSKTDTAGTSKEKDGSTKKKKKRRKNALDATDDIRKSTQKPNSADDDVIVPDN